LYIQIIDEKLKTERRGKTTKLTGRSPLGRRRSALDCSAILEEVKTINK
jgi:hypothetical protein